MKKVLSLFVLCTVPFVLNEAFAYSSADCTNVQQLSAQGIVSYRASCAEYNLDRTITRQEVAAVALKVGEVCGSIGNIAPSGGYMCENMFSDVSASYPNDWVCRVAETLARDGIVSQSDTNQYGDTFFRPLKNVTRAEALAMLLNGGNLQFQGVTYDDWRFTGTGAVSWQKPLMQYAYDRDIINSITSFGPNSNASRGDVFNYATTAINLCRGNQGNYNYNNTQCGLGQYRSGNSCYACNALPANSYYATANTCVWTCQSGYYKSGNTCVRNYNNNNNNYGTTGQCGTTVNSCLSGTFYDTVDYGNNAYWNCTGSNGIAVSCSAYNYNNNYGTTGQCGNTANSCTSGYLSNTIYNGGHTYWSCTGTNNVAVSCSAYGTNNNYGTTGQCGTTVNSCISGTFYDTTDYGNYAYWNCTGSNGTAVSCSVYNYNNNYNNCGVGQYYSGNMCLGCTTKPSNGYYTTTGTCDWTCNSGYYRSGNTCLSNYNNTYCAAGQYLSGNTCYSCGTAPWNAYYITAGSCTWTCNSGYYKSGNTCVSNYNYGTTAQCSTIANSCITGYASNLSMTGNYSYWNCNGTNGTAVSCSAYNNNYYGTTGQCGTTVNSCISGTFYDTTDYGNYAYWNCAGSNGTAVSCSVYNNNYNYTSPAVCNRPITANAYYTNNSNCWSCNAGYTLVGDLCVWWYN